MSRKLIGKNEVSEILGISKHTFDRHRSALEDEGFPKPVLNADIFGHYKWDIKAINLWLDAQIPVHLKNSHDMGMTMTIDTAAIERQLAENAAALNL